MSHCCETMSQVISAKGTRLRYDPVYAEYSLSVLDGHEFCVFYCPFCGSKAPESKRGEYFTIVTPEEKERILGLVEHLKNRTEIVQELGDPDWEHAKSEGSDPVWQKPLRFSAGMLYRRLSEEADIYFSLD